MEPHRIIWHHSADPSTGPQLYKINEHHRQRGFPKSNRGYFVGYHWLIEPDGMMWQTRDESEIGAHDTGENMDSLGICLAGDFTARAPSEAQAVSAAELVGKIRVRWDIRLSRIEPHRWDDATECPGTFLPDNWLVNEYLKRSGHPWHRVFWYIGEKLKLL